MTEIRSRADGKTDAKKPKAWSYDKKEVRIDSALKNRLDVLAARKGVYAYEPVEVGVEWVLSLMQSLPDGAGEGSVRELAKASAGERLRNVPGQYQALIRGILSFLDETPRRSAMEKKMYKAMASQIYHLAGLDAPDEL